MSAPGPQKPHAVCQVELNMLSLLTGGTLPMPPDRAGTEVPPELRSENRDLPPVAADEPITSAVAEPAVPE